MAEINPLLLLSSQGANIPQRMAQGQLNRLAVQQGQQGLLQGEQDLLSRRQDFDIRQSSFEAQEQERQRLQQARKSAGEVLLGNSEAFEELKGLDPEFALTLGENIRARSSADINDFIRDAKIGRNLLKSGADEEFIDFADRRIQSILARNGDPSQTAEVRELVAQGNREAAINLLDSFSETVESSKTTAAEREFQSLTRNLSKEERDQAAKIKLGLSPRAVGSAAQTITDRGTAEEVGDSQAIIKQKEKFAEMTGSSRAKIIDSGFERIGKIDLAINNIDRAIQKLEEGAGTGAIEQLLPSVKSASVELDQIRNEMALDVINAVTLGAISEGELSLVKETAIPKGMPEPELIEHLKTRREAQKKLRDYFQDQIEFLDGGGTVAGFIREKRRELSGSLDNSGEARQTSQTFTSTKSPSEMTDEELLSF